MPPMTLRWLLIASCGIIALVAVASHRDKWGGYFEAGTFTPRDELINMTEH